MRFNRERTATFIKCSTKNEKKPFSTLIFFSFRHNNSLLLSTGFLGDVLTLKKTLDGRIKVRRLNDEKDPIRFVFLFRLMNTHIISRFQRPLWLKWFRSWCMDVVSFLITRTRWSPVWIRMVKVVSTLSIPLVQWPNNCTHVKAVRCHWFYRFSMRM